MGCGNGCFVSDRITVQFKEPQPFVAGEQVTGTVHFQNLAKNGIKLSCAYIEFKGELVHTIRKMQGPIMATTTDNLSLFDQKIMLQETHQEFVNIFYRDSSDHWRRCSTETRNNFT